MLETQMVSAEQAILAQERTWLDRWSSGDPLGVLEVAAQEVTYLDDIGSPHVVGLEAFRSYLAAAFVGNIPAHQYEIVAPDVRVHGDVGILTYRYRPLLPDGGAWNATAIYRLIAGDWRLVHGHWSVAKG